MFYTFKNTPFLSQTHLNHCMQQNLLNYIQKPEGEFGFSHTDLLQQKVRLIFECV